MGSSPRSLRLTNVYEPGMRIKDARQTFLGIWLRRVIEGEPFEVWGASNVGTSSMSKTRLRPSS
jgi:nucleoside-diphosphate-sugar epimerase